MLVAWICWDENILPNFLYQGLFENTFAFVTFLCFSIYSKLYENLCSEVLFFCIFSCQIELNPNYQCNFSRNHQNFKQLSLYFLHLPICSNCLIITEFSASLSLPCLLFLLLIYHLCFISDQWSIEVGLKTL